MKDLKAEERYKKALLEAEQENDKARIAELRENYSNTPAPVNYIIYLFKFSNKF